jgi:hypothetical protein
MTRTILNVITKGGFVLAGLAVVAAPLSVKAADTTVSVDVGSVISTFTTSGTVTLGALTPDATGTQSINNDTVTVGTNDVDGFTLTLEDADATTTLASGGNSFAATSGTPGTSAALANGEWGWRVDGMAASDFGAGPTSVLSNGAPSAVKFAGIVANGDVSTPTINSSSSTGSDAVDVWFSARADDSQPTGTYTDIVTYTATVN